MSKFIRNRFGCRRYGSHGYALLKTSKRRLSSVNSWSLRSKTLIGGMLSGEMAPHFGPSMVCRIVPPPRKVRAMMFRVRD
jgi:hypothetical protein